MPSPTLPRDAIAPRHARRQISRGPRPELRGRLRSLADKLDLYLAREYGVDAGNAMAFEAWRRSHEPFHWIAEFYGIMRGGGFGVIIGNPPYLERSKLKGSYEIRDYKSSDCRDIYAWFS